MFRAGVRQLLQRGERVIGELPGHIVHIHLGKRGAQAERDIVLSDGKVGIHKVKCNPAHDNNCEQNAEEGEAGAPDGQKGCGKKDCQYRHAPISEQSFKREPVGKYIESHAPDC